MRKTKRQRMRLDFTVLFEEELESIFFYPGDGEIYQEAIANALKKISKKHKKVAAPLAVGPIYFHVDLDFRQPKAAKVKATPKKTASKERKSSKCDDHRCE